MTRGIWQVDKADATSAEARAVISEFHRRQIYAQSEIGKGRPPIFVSRIEEVHRLLGGKTKSYVSQLKDFFKNVMKILLVQPVSQFKLTPITVMVQVCYWITTQKSAWFSLPGMDTVALRPNIWSEYRAKLYGFFTDREITLSNQPDVIFIAELIISGEETEGPITYEGTRAGVREIEQALARDYTGRYSLAEIRNALYLAVAKNWILFKKLQTSTPSSEWTNKLKFYGFVDQYALCTACRTAYRRYVERSIRVATRNRIVEILFSLATDAILMAHIAKAFPGAIEVVKEIVPAVAPLVVPPEVPLIVPPEAPPEAPPIKAGVLGLWVLGIGSLVGITYFVLSGGQGEKKGL